MGIRPENITLVGPDKDNIGMLKIVSAESYEHRQQRHEQAHSSGIEQREKDTDL
jgi:hypothetical protein